MGRLAMMDGLYAFTILMPAHVRHGVLLKQGRWLFGRAGDFIVAGEATIIHGAIDLQLTTWEYGAEAGTDVTGEMARIRLCGLASRGGARLVGAIPDAEGAPIGFELHLLRSPNALLARPRLD